MIPQTSASGSSRVIRFAIFQVRDGRTLDRSKIRVFIAAMGGYQVNSFFFTWFNYAALALGSVKAGRSLGSSIARSSGVSQAVHPQTTAIASVKTPMLAQRSSISPGIRL